MNQKRHVLLVEDIESTIDIVRKQLECLDYEVAVARHGLEALNQLAEQVPDLVVMDIRLPQMDGLETVGYIRATPVLRDIPILAATAKVLKGDEERCLAAGCDGYIAKPFTHRQLETAINEVFKRRNILPTEVR